GDGLPDEITRPPLPSEIPQSTRRPGSLKRIGLIAIAGTVVVAGGVVAAVLFTKSPAPAPIKSLRTIMKANGSQPLATHCEQAPPQGRKATSLKRRLYCTQTSNADVVLWAYQFTGHPGYGAGVRQLNQTLKFNAATADSHCPPASGHNDGRIGWHSRPHYPS